jgi:glycosyltransferase involved in cell wall biosynthesis
MRVLHIITGLDAGGAEHQLRLLLRGLRSGIECEVVTLTNPGPVADAIRADGTPVHVLGMRGNNDLTALPRLVRLIRAGRFDIVHTHLYRACVYGRIAARLAGVRHVVATEHSLGDGLIEGRRTTASVRALYLAAERVAAGPTVAVSQAVEQRLVAWGVRPARITVIPNGIDPDELAFDAALRRRARRSLGLPQDAFVVGGLGRLEPTKRFDLLIEAVRPMRDVTLLLVGDGSARGQLEAQAGERVIFAGATEHARGALCAMDLLASPSEQETFNLAVLEALANGLHVLYTTCPPLDELAAPVEAAGTVDLSPREATTKLPADAARYREAIRQRLSTLDTSRTTPVVPAPYRADLIAGMVSDLYANLANRSPQAAGKKQ